jgi:hypothetical protein
MHPALKSRAAKTWLAVTAWWLLTGVVATSQSLTMLDAQGATFDIGFIWRAEMASSILWIPLTMGLFWCVRRYPIGTPPLHRAIAVLTAAVVGVILLRAATVVALNDWIGWYDKLPTMPALLWKSTLNNFLMSWMIIGVAHALVYAERDQRRRAQAQVLETQLANARLGALAAQLNPHFLFNTLNSIAEMVHRDADVADRMLVGLGELLRQSLSSEQLQEVSLGDELELLDCYVDIEQMRLGDRLKFDRDIPQETLGARVPHLLLQPLVENAIKHAIAPRPSPGHVSVRVERDSDRLVLEVRDDGDGRDEPTAKGAGIGLSSTRARLQALYGDDHSFSVRAQPEGGTVARVVVPWRHWPAAA